MCSDCALNNACNLVFWASVCSERLVLFVRDFQTNKRISALENTIAGLRREPKTPNAIAVGLGTREKRSTSNNASPSASALEKRVQALEKRYEIFCLAFVITKAFHSLNYNM